MKNIEQFIQDYKNNTNGLTDAISPLFHRLFPGDYDGIVAIGQLAGYDFTEIEFRLAISKNFFRGYGDRIEEGWPVLGPTWYPKHWN